MYSTICLGNGIGVPFIRHNQKSIIEDTIENHMIYYFCMEQINNSISTTASTNKSAQFNNLINQYPITCTLYTYMDNDFSILNNKYIPLNPEFVPAVVINSSQNIKTVVLAINNADSISHTGENASFIQSLNINLQSYGLDPAGNTYELNIPSDIIAYDEYGAVGRITYDILSQKASEYALVVSNGYAGELEISPATCRFNYIAGFDIELTSEQIKEVYTKYGINGTHRGTTIVKPPTLNRPNTGGSSA